MAFCSKCGTQYEEGTKFCPSCGATTEAQQGAAQQQAQSQTDFSAKFSNLNNTADTTADFDAADIEQNKVMGVLAYLSWLVLIPLFAAKNSKFARFHCNQGIVLALIEIIAGVAFGILSVIPFIGFIFSIAGWLVNIICFIFSIIGIVNAVNGKAKELPIVGKFKILK